MASPNQITILIRAVAEGVQDVIGDMRSLGAQVTQTTNATKTFTDVRGAFAAIRETAQTLGQAFAAVSQGVVAAGDVSAQTALKYERLQEAISDVTAESEKLAAKYEEQQAEGQKLGERLKALQTVYLATAAALAKTPKSADGYAKLASDADRLRNEIRQTEAALESNGRTTDATAQRAAALGREIQNLNERLRDEKARLQDVSASQSLTRFDALKSKFVEIGGAVRSAGEGIRSVGLALSVVSVGIAALGGGSVKAAADFESAMLGVKSKTNASAEEMKKLADQALALGATTKFSAKEVAEGQTDLAAAGMKTTEVLAALPTVLKLAQAGKLEVARAAEIASDTLSQFGFQANETGRVADVLVKAADSSSISVDQLAFTFKYVGPLAQATGQSFEEMAAAAVLLGNAGIKGEQAGTVLRGAMSALLAPSKEVEQTLQRLGVTVTDGAGKLLPFNEILRRLESSGATTADVMKIFGQEAGGGVLALFNKGSGALRDMTAEMLKAAGTTDRVAEILGSGVASKLKILENALNVLLIKVGGGLQPVLGPALDFITGSVLPMLQGLADWFASQSAPVKAFIAVIAGVAAALGPVIAVIGTLIVALGGVIAAVGAIASAVAGAVAAVGVAPLLAAIGAALVGIGAALAATVTSVVVFARAWQTNFAGIRDFVIPAMQAVREFVIAAAGEIVAWWQANFPKIREATAVVLNWIEQNWRMVMALIGPVARQAWEFVKGVVVTAGRVIGNAIMLTVNILRGDWPAVWQSARNIVGSVMDGVKSFVVGGVNVMIRQVNLLLETITDAINSARALIGLTPVLSWRIGQIQNRTPEFTAAKEQSDRQAFLQRQASVDLSKPLTGGGNLSEKLFDWNGDGKREAPRAELPPPGKTGGGGSGKGKGGGESADDQLQRQIEDARAKLEQRLALAKTLAENEAALNKDGLDRQLKDLDENYQLRLISDEEYVQEKTRLRAALADAEIAAVRREEAAEAARALGLLKAQEEAAKIRDPKKRAEERKRIGGELAESGNKILKLVNDLELAERRRADVAVQGNREITRSLQEQQKRAEDLYQSLLQLQSPFDARRFDVNRQADAELDKIRKGLSGQVVVEGETTAAIQLTDEERKQVELINQRRTLLLAQVEIDESRNRIQRLFNEMQREENELQREARRIGLSQLEVDERRDEIQRGYKARIEAERDRLKDAVGRNPTDENQEAVNQTNEQIASLGNNAQTVGAQVRQGLLSSFENFFKDIMSGAKSAKQAFLDFGASVLGMIQQMIARMLAMKLLGALFKGFGFAEGGPVGDAEGFASGGFVSGPGGPTDDKIPAYLSNGEFVQPADATQYYGADFMEMIRNKSLPRGLAALLSAPVRLAEGGPVFPTQRSLLARVAPSRPQSGAADLLRRAGVGGRGAESPDPKGNGPREIRNIIVFDRKQIGEYLGTTEGVETLITQVGENKRDFQRALGIA